MQLCFPQELHTFRAARIVRSVYYFSGSTSTDMFASKLTTHIVSTFSVYYATQWPSYFPDQPLTPPMPSFDGRAILYPDVQTIRDYMSWRQVDCMRTSLKYSTHGLLTTTRSYQQSVQHHLLGTRSKRQHDNSRSQQNIRGYFLQ